MSLIPSDYWGSSDMVFQCLIDKKRAFAFKKAIINSVKKNDVVVDLGTGTGILSLFAMEAGAKRIYAVEADKGVYETFKKNLYSNGFHNKITLLHGDATSIALPEKVDVVICEMIATGLIDELQIPVMNHIHTFCKKNTKIILNRLLNFVDLVYVNNKFYGHKLKVMQYRYTWANQSPVKSFSKPLMYRDVDFAKKNDDVINFTEEIKALKNGVINSIRITNKTFFVDGTTLRETDAYCMPLILPVDEIRVKKNDRIKLKLKYKMCQGMQHLSYSLQAV